MSNMNSIANGPASAQQFCLKWNNYTSNLVKTFSQMATDQSFVDVTLACEGSSIKAHKVVLSACSNYFKELFLANPCKHPIVILKDMKMEDLKAIIDFMYKGEVNVFHNQLGALLKTAEILKVKGLTEVNDENEKSHSDHIHMNPKEEKITQDPSIERNGASNEPIVNQNITRKKRRKKHKRNVTDVSDGLSGSDSASCTDEESNMVQIPNRIQVDQIANTPSINNEASNSLLPRKKNVSQTMPQNIQPQRELVDNSDYGQLEDNTEPWNRRERLQLSGPMEADDESDADGVIDVKPIVSFDEGSIGVPINNNQLSIPQDNSLVSHPDYSSLSPGSAGNSSTGKLCVCHLCHLTFTAYSSLRRHMQRHYADRERYECDICFKSYSRKDYLKEHKKLKHEKMMENITVSQQF